MAGRAGATDDLVDALLRECLKRTGLTKTLHSYDKERPVNRWSHNVHTKPIDTISL